MEKGKIKFYNPEKRFGFIIPSNPEILNNVSNEDIYFKPEGLSNAFSDCEGLLVTGRRVDFQISKKDTTKGISIMAVNIIPEISNTKTKKPRVKDFRNADVGGYVLANRGKYERE